MTLEAPPSPAVAVPPPSPADAGTKRKAEDPPTPAAARASDDADGPKHASDSATKLSRYVPTLADAPPSAIPGSRAPGRAPPAADASAHRDSYVVSSSRGYSTSQSELRAATGAWYFEVVVARLGDAGHARVGWAERLAETDAPVGADASGYAYCDVGGEKVHAGRREPYGEAFVAGDVVGCYLEVTRGERPAARRTRKKPTPPRPPRRRIRRARKAPRRCPSTARRSRAKRLKGKGLGIPTARAWKTRRRERRRRRSRTRRAATSAEKAPTRIASSAASVSAATGVAGRGVRAARLRADHLSQRVPSVRVALHARQGGRAPRREGGVQLWADVRVPGFDIRRRAGAAPDVRRGEGARGAARSDEVTRIVIAAHRLFDTHTTYPPRALLPPRGFLRHASGRDLLEDLLLSFAGFAVVLERRR